ncbi:Gfo/Idh/MocA family protein [Pararobbsia silviterrae]|uniref:Gfo/Idh/MocA family oxidoreductase n=1 Tax=Pararobbsia silviterrae TaxID=1792498 RepID=A0A494XS00_9BURK|nr:Gfo/Idh/MocA family oxidoreductase [Pararobbsia silviterrae]RKP53410.1 gfo/Idh/MocA family oxidoreductase [Pararobbsia silviterrae]
MSVPSVPLRVAVVGCGNISDIYLKSMPKFAALRVVGVSDLDPARASAHAAKYGIARAIPLDQVFTDPDVDLILNLTTPESHAAIALRALEAGKHVYGEKPLALNVRDGRRIVETARANGLRVGSAPDTVLGAGLQTCRALIEAGEIGEPVAASAFMTTPGHERWHPNPDFYYQPGAGPMFDMGPYYLSALVNLIGPITDVSGMARATYAERTISSEPRRGERIKVNTPTHIASQLGFANGAIGTIVTSFDVWGAALPRIEVYGTQGSLSVPDPNTFGGVVRIKRREAEWEDVPLTRPYSENTRGLGVADLAESIVAGRAHRANGELALHVLEVMQATLDAAAQRRTIEIETRTDKPLPMASEPFAENVESLNV